MMKLKSGQLTKSYTATARLQQQAEISQILVAGATKSNEFGDKSKEETGNTLTDKNIQQLMMKRQMDEIVEKVDSALSSLNELCERVEDIEEGNKDE